MKTGTVVQSTLFCALVALIMNSCEHLNTNVPQGKGYLDGYGKSGVETEIPWDMRLGQGFWDDPGNTPAGQEKIIIDTQEQKAYFYKGDVMVGKTPISTGSEGHDTPLGTYKIQEKKRIHYSSTWGNAIDRATGEVRIKDFNAKTDKMPAGCYYKPADMPYALRIKDGYFMHVGYVPGFAASHGCIRVPADMAQKFWENAYKGMTVIIK